MNRTLSPAFLLLALGALCFAVDDRQEPPLKYVLEINGKEHQLFVGKAVTIRGEFKDPTVLLKAASTRTFAYGDLTFRYPASFTWEAEIEAPNEKTWTLSGNDFKILYFVLPAPLTVDDYAAAMVGQIGNNKSRIHASERELGDRKYKGKRLAVDLAGTQLTMEIYAFPAKEGARLLVLQDSLGDDGKTSAEGARALKLLSETFRDTAKGSDSGVGGGR